jgi:hypothetical protein
VLTCLLVLRLLLARGADAAVLYRRLSRLAGWLRAGPRQGQTPLEWARGVAAAAPTEGSAVLTIVELYARQCYGNYQPDRGDLTAARACWRLVQRRWLWRLLTRRPI